MHKAEISFRKVLLSSGEFTPEAVIDDGRVSVFESAPEGLTVGLKEKEKESGSLPKNFILEYDNLPSQKEFDSQYARKYGRDVSTALSLAYLKYMATLEGASNLSSFLSRKFDLQKSQPLLIFNILNGGKHAGNGLSFCEFMIIPKQNNAVFAINTASEVYNDLKALLLDRKSVV